MEGPKYQVFADFRSLSPRFIFIVCILFSSALTVAYGCDAMMFGSVDVLSLYVRAPHPNFLSSFHASLLDVCRFSFSTVSHRLGSEEVHQLFLDHHFHESFGPILDFFEASQ